MYLKSMYPSPPPPPEVNVHNVLFRRPEQASWPDYTLHIDSVTGRKRTFREFLERVYDGATVLGAPVSQGGLGLRGEDGEIVGILSENSMDYIALMHSLLVITTPFALLSSYSTGFELNHALQLSKATCLFVNAKLLSKVLPVAKKVGIPSSKIYILDGHAPGRKNYGDFVKLAQSQNIPRAAVRPATKDTLAYLVFSSGTSGLPKAVMITHKNLIYSLHQVAVTAKEVQAVYTPPPPKTPEGFPVMLAFLPIHHTYGLNVYCFRAFAAPACLVVLAKWDIDNALTAISKYRVTNLTLVPSVVHQLVHHPKIHRADLSSVISINSGAAYLPPELNKKLTAFAPPNATFFQGYGMSECTVAAITQPVPGVLGGIGKRVIGSTGILLPGMDAKLLRDDGSHAEVNEEGELYLKGENVSPGYWNNEQANRETYIDGWLRTGDRFRVDENGYFFFADRTKDTLKVSGAQVSPVEIEAVLLAHPDNLITDVTVAGVSGGRTSDEKVPRAWIVLSDTGKKKGATAVIRALELWCQEHLSKYKWLRGGIEVVEEIPKNPTGKVLRRVLQDRYEQQQQKRVKSKL